MVAIDYLGRSGSSMHQIEFSHIAYQGGCRVELTALYT